MRRRFALLTGLTTLAALAVGGTVLAPSATAGGACFVDDGELVVSAPVGSTLLNMVATSDTIDVYVDNWDSGIYCSVGRSGISSVRATDAQGNIANWVVDTSEASFPGPVELPNDASDRVTLVGTTGSDSWSWGTGDRLLLEDDARTDRTLAMAATPETLTLRTLGGGGSTDVVDLTTSGGYRGDVALDTEGLEIRRQAVAHRRATPDVVARLGRGSDYVTTTDLADMISTGAGSDLVESFGGNDVVDAGRGPDEVQAGEGRDRIVDTAVDDAHDYYSGGAGADRLDYRGRTREVYAEFADVVADGRPDDSDVLADLEKVFGSSLDDTLKGGDGRQVILGLGGGDALTGGAGEDTLRGGDGADWLLAKDGEADLLDGGAGRDGARRDASDTATSVEYRLR